MHCSHCRIHTGHLLYISGKQDNQSPLLTIWMNNLTPDPQRVPIIRCVCAYIACSAPQIHDDESLTTLCMSARRQVV